MFMTPRETMPVTLEDEFSKPVESIMRCEDFKSNFARRLSNRYISRSPISSPRQDPSLKLHPADSSGNGNGADNVPESIELGSQLFKNVNMEQNGDAVKPPDRAPLTSSDLRKTEVSVLNMEVETLRWQLAQTEANRQMHIALLKQIVAFLNRVKEHIESQNSEAGYQKPSKLISRNLNITDLPRSRSVVHVNRTVEYSLTTPKKISTKKISKSISNVNGFKDYNGIWSQSKLSLTPENENSQKISEEMTRLVTLANTVLSTKIPDLACGFTDKHYDRNIIKQENKTIIEVASESNTISVSNANGYEKVVNYDVQVSKANDNNILPIEKTTDYFERSGHDKFNDSVLSLYCGEENVYSEIKLPEKDKITMEMKGRSDIIINTTVKSSVPRLDFSSAFIEDESGFSSMSSFQEIGIPIISIIPPSPSEEIGFMEDIPDITEDSEKWKTDTLELDKQTVKVFWV